MWVTKALGTTVWITVFFVFYFEIMNLTAGAVTVMPLTAFDRWIEVREWTAGLYVSLWVYVALAPALAGHRTEIGVYCRAAALMSVLGLGFFWLFPTAVPIFDVDWAQYPALAYLKAADVAGNAFPSLHVSFAVFSAAVIHHQLRAIGAPRGLRLVNALWCVGIVYSTLATRQHVVLDVLGGVALAGLTWWVYVLCIPRGHAMREVRRWRARPPAIGSDGEAGGTVPR